MPDYDLTRLGTRSFEQLIVSLGRLELGAGMSVFGDGRDGGREATFDGTINWSATQVAAEAGSAHAVRAEDQWSGHTVIQSKFRQKPATRPLDNASWLQGQIKKEIDDWTEATRDKSRKRPPDYLIFVTNLDLSAVAQTGGIDSVEAYISKLTRPDSEAVKAGLRVQGFKIWHADQIRTMLDAHQDVRWAFDGLITVGDVLATLQRERPVRLGSGGSADPIREELVAGLSADRWIRLSEAGGPGDAKRHLDDVIIDVPATTTQSSPVPGVRLGTADLAATATFTIGVTGSGDQLEATFSRPVRAAAHVLERGDMALGARQAQREGPAAVVLVGGPGQGKTTMSKLLAQAYRAAMLDDTDLSPTAREQVDATKLALERIGLALPGNRRWPIRVDLAKYAEELSSGAETSLLRWMSQLVSKRTTSDVTATQLSEWLNVCPWAVILDGLDEVPSVQARLSVYKQMEHFWTKVDDLGADVLMVITTRPTGYDERLPDGRYEHLQLEQLPAKEAAEFAEWLTAKRFHNDVDMQREVTARMQAAAATPTTARLMGTPLQVTIMTMIVEKHPTLPPDRYTLFNLYYDTVLDREIAKNISISRFLSEYRQDIHGLHERVGLALHVQSEASEGADAVMSTADLQALAEGYMQARGFKPEHAEAMAVRLVEAALTRLVLLVPREEGVGFEVRTLQELMTARALVEGTDEQIRERLKMCAYSAHWRNAWLLAAGKLLLASTRFEALLAELLRALGGDATLPVRVSPGPVLAADLLMDGLGERRPTFDLHLTQILLTARDNPPIGPLDTLAAALSVRMDGTYRETVANHLKSASGTTQRASALAILEAMRRQLTEDDGGRRQTLRVLRLALAPSAEEELVLKAFLSRTQQRLESEPAQGGGPTPTRRRRVRGEDGGTLVLELLAKQLDGLGLDKTQAQRLTDALGVLSGARVRVTETEPPMGVLMSGFAGDPTALLKALEDEDLAVALRLALGGLPAGMWAVPALLASVLNHARTRTFIGQDVQDLISVQASNAG
jgi:hypothetical protein